MKGLLNEFKTFISKGNILDLAVAVVIGTAFKQIVSSLVDDIIMPLVGAILGGTNFTHLHIEIGDSYITYGNFIQNIVDFLLIALSVFFVMKFIEKFQKEEEAAPEAPAKKSDDVVLLEEIRDLLKEQPAAKKTVKAKTAKK